MTKRGSVRVLMFGWEFPPMSSGGLGTACYGLTKGLHNQGIEVTFVMPYVTENVQSDVVKLISPGMKVKVRGVSSSLRAYDTHSSYSERYQRLHRNNPLGKLYGKNLHEEVQRFALEAAEIAKEENFDVIHCHDWMTFLAGIKASEVSQKPLLVHVHATEFDRAGKSANQTVYNIERLGMRKADGIISVSHFTKNKIVDHYGIPPEKIRVVHNAVDLEPYQGDFHIENDDKIVLFLGRITMQKGPDYFIQAAKRCLDIDPHIRFVMAGTGDMEGYIIEKAAELGIADRVLFAGFLSGTDIDRMYRMADVYVMPSVSEPFGITPLEAMRNGTPAIISKQSGVSEVLSHCLKVDFWDIDQLVDKIIAVLRYEELHKELKHHGSLEISKFSWNEPARKCIEYYQAMMG